MPEPRNPDPPGNLPAELSSFIGRRREMADIRSLMSGGRLVTLVGMGGVGKTRLSRQVARSWSRAFADGVWQVELADLHEPALLVPSIAAAVGLREQTRTATLDTVRAGLLPRRLLLVLDNCEHLVGSVADVVDALCRGCPELHILATSREVLGVPGERTYTVLPFAVPGARDGSAVDMPTGDAMTLFLERAAEIVPGFALTHANATAVAALCRRLDGVPLAIELAAAWLRTLSPEDLLGQLTEHRGLLSLRYRGVPTRQQSLDSLVDWSYRLCDADEQELWRMASIFAQGFELDAAGFLIDATCRLDGRRLVQAVDGLVAKSVVFTDRAVETRRYRMPEIIREYGLRRLTESGEELSVRLAHRDWCVETATRARSAWVGPSQLAWFARIRRELPNIRAAVEFSLTRPGGESEVVDIISSLVSYWIALGWLSEGAYWLRAARAGGLSDSHRLTALCTEAMLATVQGDRGVVEYTLDVAWKLAASGAGERDIAWLTFASARAALYALKSSEARRQLDDAARRFDAVEDLDGLVWTLCASVINEATSSNPGAALDRFAAYERAADPHGEAWTRSYSLFGVAFAHWRTGDLDAATTALRDCLRLRAPFEDDFVLGQGLELLAWITAAEGEPAAAAELMGRAGGALFAAGSSVSALRYLVGGHERCEQGLREALGHDAFEAAFEGGRVLPLSGGDVRSESEETATRRRAGTAAVTPLTRRENEVAALVADGLSNREIASRLLISLRTAETHVEHILVKLGFSSRTQVAAWRLARR